MKRFNVVLPKGDAGVEMFPMKEWLRNHPEHIPPGLDATSSTSHQLRAGLKKAGWSVQENASEVLMLMPQNAPAATALQNLFGDEEAEEVEADTNAGDPYFSLEYQLRDFIAENLPSLKIGDRRLQLYVDPMGRDGIEYPTAVGPIDILATDDKGDLFVFELKRATSSDRAVGQLARYMGWARQTIGKDKVVSGIIVAKEISTKLRYAVSVVPNVSLFEYQIEFHLRSANELPS